MGYLDKAGLSRAFTKLKTLIDKKVDTHTWNAVSQGGTWSRICHVNCQSNVIGSSFFLNVRGTRSSVVFNATFIVTASHSQQANIIQLQSTTYSPFKIRTLSDSSGNCYVEIYDDVAGIASGTSQTLVCTIIPITTGTVTKYTSFTSGATVPSGYAIAKTMTVTAENAIVADLFIGNLSGADAWVSTVHGSLDGNASSASKAAQLTTARTIQTNLGSTSSALFDGTANVSPGITGTLPIGNGGTGTTTANGIRTNVGINPVATAGTGSAYTATVSGLTLSVGAKFVMVPHTVSTTTAPTLNVNNLGAKIIRLRLSSAPQSTTALTSADFIQANKPITVVYDGTQWVIDDMVQPNANNLYGTVPISKGGTGATTAVQARQNLGIKIVSEIPDSPEANTIYIKTL